METRNSSILVRTEWRSIQRQGAAAFERRHFQYFCVLTLTRVVQKYKTRTAASQSQQW